MSGSGTCTAFQKKLSSLHLLSGGLLEGKQVRRKLQSNEFDHFLFTPAVASVAAYLSQHRRYGEFPFPDAPP